MNHAEATIAATPIEPTAPVLLEYGVPERTLIGHPTGLFVLFLVEMWERFSYYGMRALLVLYLTTSVSPQMSNGNPGRGWSTERAGTFYGWYTGMAYLLPIFGGIIADKLIGAHRSMLVGAVLITLGHLTLAASGIGGLAANAAGMSVFVLGLALIVIGTGHFKPNVSVMVGGLYREGDPRRDSAFTIFYMGINIGAFVCAFVCGTLGEKVGWHWGFGSAAVGMLIGLIIYVWARPKYLPHVGEAPVNGATVTAIGFGLLGAGLAGLTAFAFHFDLFGRIGAHVSHGDAILWAFTVLVAIAVVWFIATQEPVDRGPVAAILIFIVFNAIFWLAFEQAGTSLNLFAADMTDRHLGGWEMPATWFQSVGALLVIALAPVFAGLWSALERRGMNPSQPTKIAIGLILIGGAFGFMVLGSLGTTPEHRASMFWLIATYAMCTFGELAISPTGLSFVTRASPVRFVSLLMGLSFLSNSLANWAGGRIAGQIDNISAGKVELFWFRWFKLGGQADFFFLFVLSSIVAGVVVLALTPALKRMLGDRA